MIKVSVIIPIYNKEKYLSKTIESVLQQSLAEIEIILVNDGSTDSSLEICRSYEKKDSRIKVINQNNKGVSAARNQGIFSANGEYIGFVDADDTIDQDMYLNMYNRCINDNSDVSMCNFIEYDNAMKKTYSEINTDFDYNKQKSFINEIIGDMIAPASFDGNSQIIMGYVWRFLIKREILLNESITFIKGIPLMEDLLFCIDVLTSIESLSIDNSFYYHYYSIEESASKIYRENFHENSLKVTNFLVNILLKKNKYNFFEERINNRLFLTSMGSIVNVLNLKNNSTIVEKLSDIKKICVNSDLKKAMLKINRDSLSKKNKFKFYAIYNEKILLLYVYHFFAVRKVNFNKRFFT